MKTFTCYTLVSGLAVLSMGTAGAATILSVTGNFAGGNDVFISTPFAYDPATMGEALNIQSYGYGGSANAPGGTNASGLVIPAGGFDPIVALYRADGARLAFNDDGTCGPGLGTLVNNNCFDSRLGTAGLAAGNYTVVLTAFFNVPPTTLSGTYSAGGAFSGRTSAFALDVTTSATAPSTSVPEPVSSTLFGSGLLALSVLNWRKRNS